MNLNETSLSKSHLEHNKEKHTLGDYVEKILLLIFLIFEDTIPRSKEISLIFLAVCFVTLSQRLLFMLDN